MQSRSHVRLGLAWMLSVATVAACSDGTGPAPPIPVSSVTISAPITTLEVGQTTTLVGVPRDADGRALSGRMLEWSSGNGAVATVSGTGLVTAVAAGSVSIAATSEGKRAELTIAVILRANDPEPPPPPSPPPPVAELRLDRHALALEEGDAQQLVATPLDASGAIVEGVTVGWRTSDAAVAEVSTAGMVRGKKMGTTTITASAGGTSAQVTVSVFGRYPYELLFDRWSAFTGGLMRSELFRLSLNWPTATPVRVMNAGGRPFRVSASPDGERLAFSCGAQPAICVGDRFGDYPIPVASLHANYDQPVWSPDGTRIAFRRWAAGGPPGVFNPADIWVMNADGSNKVNLTAGSPSGTSRQSPTWSPRQPDGSYRIAYAEERLAHGYLVSQIRSMRDDGSDRQDVTTLGEYADLEPAWSPSGQVIAFVRSGVTWNSELFVVTATGGAERPLLATPLGDVQRDPAWSPDGTMLAFASNHEIIGAFITFQIYTVKSDGGDVVRRTADNTEKQNPAWRKIVQ